MEVDGPTYRITFDDCVTKVEFETLGMNVGVVVIEDSPESELLDTLREGLDSVLARHIALFSAG